MLSATKNPISINRQKIRSKTRKISEKRLKSYELQFSTKLQVISFLLKLRVANYGLNLELQFSQTLKSPVAKVFYGLNFKLHVIKTSYWKLNF